VGVSNEDEAVEAKNLLNLFVSLQQRMVPLSAGVLAAGACSNLLSFGPAALPSMVQLGMCLAWVVWVMYTGVNNALLFDLWNWCVCCGGPAPAARLAVSSKPLPSAGRRRGPERVRGTAPLRSAGPVGSGRARADRLAGPFRRSVGRRLRSAGPHRRPRSRKAVGVQNKP
jgi:hypothetical protein